MQLKLPEIEIPKDDPFANDALNRKANIEILTQVLKSTHEPLVLAINAPWGAGKTTFVRMWEQYLVINNFTTLYFNAWENDFTENPLIAFISEIEEIVKKFSNVRSIKSKANKLKKVGLKILKA